MPELQVLVSLSMILAARSFAAGTPGMFDVATYGAMGDGKALDSPASDKAHRRRGAIPSLVCSA
jgi:hypothetical protein